MKVDALLFGQMFRKFLTEHIAPNFTGKFWRWGIGAIGGLSSMDAKLAEMLSAVGIAQNNLVDLDAVRTLLYGGFDVQASLPLEDLVEVFTDTIPEPLSGVIRGAVKGEGLEFTRDDADAFLRLFGDGVALKKEEDRTK